MTVARKVRTALLGEPASSRILIFDGEPVVGRALELLLRTTGYDAKHVPYTNSLSLGTLEGVRILILAPGWSTESRRVAEAAVSKTGGKGWRILEMGTPPDDATTKPARYVPWPLGTDQLRRRIDTLLTGSVAKDEVSESGR